MSYKKNRFLAISQLIQKALTSSTCFLYQGWRAGRLFKHCGKLFSLFIKTSQLFVDAIQHEVFNSKKITDQQFNDLRIQTKAMHSALSDDPHFTFSILIPVYHPKIRFLQLAIQSALHQTAIDFEVLIGFDGPQPEEVYEAVENLKAKHANLRSFQLDRGGISATTNALAAFSKKNYLVLMDHDDWMRPDLLYHYEVSLRKGSQAESKVLYCNEFLIDENDYPILHQRSEKPATPRFPYFFINSVCHCLLLSRKLWNQVGGLRKECDGGQDYDLMLRLNLVGADFENIPLHLYAWRSHAESTAQNTQVKPYAVQAPIKALTDYCQKRQLDWQISHGYLPTTYRAIPVLSNIPKVQVIIALESHSKDILETIKSIKRQEGVITKITIIGSKPDFPLDPDIDLWNEETPFHLPKLYNIVAKRPSEEELILFLRSGITLDKEALVEMCRWALQPRIGMVGCRLQDAKGFLLHGGIEAKIKDSLSSTLYHYAEQGVSLNQLCVAKQLRVVYGISTQCALMQRKHFLEIGGFDEVEHPHSNIDIPLSLKFNRKGFLNFYTPYAIGTV